MAGGWWSVSGTSFTEQVGTSHPESVGLNTRQDARVIRSGAGGLVHGSALSTQHSALSSNLSESFVCQENTKVDGRQKLLGRSGSPVFARSCTGIDVVRDDGTSSPKWHQNNLPLRASLQSLPLTFAPETLVLAVSISPRVNHSNTLLRYLGETR